MEDRDPRAQPVGYFQGAFFPFSFFKANLYICYVEKCLYEKKKTRFQKACANIWVKKFDMYTYPHHVHIQPIQKYLQNKPEPVNIHCKRDRTAKPADPPLTGSLLATLLGAFSVLLCLVLMPGHGAAGEEC